MNSLRERKVADVVTANIQTADIFKKHGIDFCCGGGISIERACAKKQIDPAVIEQEILALGAKNTSAPDYNQWPLDELVDHILSVHHSYVKEAIPLVLQYSGRVAEVHGHHYTEVIEIDNLFHTMAQELTMHMHKEEMILFPFIHKLVQDQKNARKGETFHCATISSPIQVMEEEHEQAGEMMRKIATLSNNFTPPEGACNTFRALYHKLQEFEKDLHLHVHLENNVLFPKALIMEQQVTNQETI